MTTVYTELPLFSDPIYEYTVSLESQQRVLTFYYNETDFAWRMDLRNIDGTAVATGIKLVPEYPILGNFRSPYLSGYFILSTENTKQSERFFTDISIVPNFYRLFHIYDDESGQT